MTVSAEIASPDAVYIDGEWWRPKKGSSIDVVNPTTEDVIATVPDSSSDDTDRAVAAARRAFDDWSHRPRKERAAFLSEIGAGLAARGDELATLITSELGMPFALSRRIQVGLPVNQFSSIAAWMDDVAWEEQIGNSLVVREAAGVVGAITPWNYPLHQIACKVAPALAAGCTVVLKPSGLAPLNSFVLADVVEKAGLPQGVFNLVSGSGTVVGERLCVHPGVDVISFTGSTATGRRVGELAAGTLKRSALELGGKSPNVVLDDADLEKAIPDAVAKCLLNSGQTCSALTRLIVSRAQLGDVEEIAKASAETWKPGDPFEKSTRLGPLVSAEQRAKVRGYIAGGLAEGARLVTGGVEPPEGLRRGFFVQPTVFSRVDSKMSIAQEEIFGPVLVILAYDDEADAVRIANDSSYGLAGGVWSADEDRAKRVALQLRTGQVEINGAPFNPAAPFGGYKHSGHGRENGYLAISEFLEVKALQL